MGQGLQDALGTAQETAADLPDLGVRVLEWIEDPSHWIPAILILVGIGLWRGSIHFDRSKRSDASIVRMVDERIRSSQEIPVVKREEDEG